MKPLFELTPKQIVKELDHYIVGQDEAKKAVAIALRNRWRRRQIEEEIRDEIIPNNILMIGPTGVGKTEIARRLAKLSGAPFIKLEASKFTEVGYVGRDVESIIRDLIESAVSQVRTERTKEVEIEAEIRVEERILDILLPPPRRKTEMLSVDSVFSMNDDDDDDDDDEESENEVEADLPEKYLRSRDKMRKRLHEGKFDDTLIEIETAEKTSGMMQVFGPIGVEEMGINLQEMLGNMLPSRKKKRKMTVIEAENYLINEEIDKLLDMDEIVQEAIFRTEEMGMVFLDEIDKIAASEPGHGPDVSREGVQRDILPLIEGTRVMTKYGPINTDHILFVAAGAFHISRPSDLIPELQGRFPIRVELNPLDKKDFVKILTQPKNSLVKQYTALLKSEKVDLSFEPDAIREIAEFASSVNDQMENIGARRLQTVMNALLEDFLFKIPSKTIKNIVINKKMVKESLSSLLENEDLSRYIL